MGRYVDVFSDLCWGYAQKRVETNCGSRYSWNSRLLLEEGFEIADCRLGLAGPKILLLAGCAQPCTALLDFFFLPATLPWCSYCDDLLVWCEPDVVHFVFKVNSSVSPWVVNSSHFQSRVVRCLLQALNMWLVNLATYLWLFEVSNDWEQVSKTARFLANGLITCGGPGVHLSLPLINI